MRERNAGRVEINLRLASLVVLGILPVSDKRVILKANDWPTLGGRSHDGISLESGFSALSQTIEFDEH